MSNDLKASIRVLAGRLQGCPASVFSVSSPRDAGGKDHYHASVHDDSGRMIEYVRKLPTEAAALSALRHNLAVQLRARAEADAAALAEHGDAT